MFNYPNGKSFKNKTNSNKPNTNKEINAKASFSAANRGMNLEENINISNDYFLREGIALITKRPTPINVVKVDYSNGKRITDAYFEKQSTTDYNGVYKSKYMDFEAKSTRSKTSFPLNNICKHQIEHLKNVIHFNGIAFFIIQLELLNEVYLLDASYIINFYENGSRKSIPFDDIRQHGIKISQGFEPRLHYLNAVDKMYFTS